MRVLFLTPNLLPGGAERQTSILLPGLHRRGLEVGVLALDAGGPFAATLAKEGVPVDVLGMRHQLDIMPLIRSRLVRGFVPDVVVSRGVSGLYIGHALARWRRAGHIYNDHRPAQLSLSARRRAMVGLLAPRLDRVIVVSDEQRAPWLARGARGDGVVMIANGVQPPEPLEDRELTRRELGLDDDAVVALLLARLRPAKRAPDFVRAVIEARRSHPEVVGIVAGDGPERAGVAAAAGGDPGIRLLGHRDDVPRLLRAADMLVLASDSEALPMAILEAMAAGLPVVATDVGGVAELVADGETGTLVAPGRPAALARAIARLAGEPGLRAAWGAAGRERCHERWGAEAMIDAYLATIEDVVRRRGAARR